MVSALAMLWRLLPSKVADIRVRRNRELASSRIDVNKVKKKTANLLPKLTEVEQDLLSHIQDGYQLETDSVAFYMPPECYQDQP